MQERPKRRKELYIMPTIKDALKMMLADGEFKKVIKNAKGREKQNAKEFYEAIKDFNDEDFEKVPAIVFIQACKSWNVWQDIYCYLELLNNAEQTTEKA